MLRALLVVLVCLAPGCGAGGADGPGDADLADLTASAGSLNPVFDPDTDAYTITVGRLVPSATVTPTAEDAGASILVEGAAVPSGSASQPIPLGTTPASVSIDVTSADGTATHAYTVVFQRAPPTVQQAYLKASNTDEFDWFGWSAAISGDTIVISSVFESSGASGVDADGSDNSAEAAGAAYVFARTDGSWRFQAYLKPSNTDENDQFGGSVSISGDTIVIGALQEDSESNGVDGDQGNSTAKEDSGAAYVFVRSGLREWTQQAFLKASNTGAGDFFGGRVALSDNTAVVGARFEDSGSPGVDGDGADESVLNAGAAYVFTRDAGTWSQQHYVKASNTENDAFGFSVDVSGDTFVVGALSERSNATGVDGDEADNSAPAAGAGYVFR